MNESTKKMISIRLNTELIKLLEDVAKLQGSYYFDRDRTWLIEEAIKEQYQPLVSNGVS